MLLERFTVFEIATIVKGKLLNDQLSGYLLMKYSLTAAPYLGGVRGGLLFLQFRPAATTDTASSESFMKKACGVSSFPIRNLTLNLSRRLCLY